MALWEAIQNGIEYGSEGGEVVVVRTSILDDKLTVDVVQPGMWGGWEETLGERRQREIRAQREGQGGTAQMILFSERLRVTEEEGVGNGQFVHIYDIRGS